MILEAITQTEILAFTSSCITSILMANLGGRLTALVRRSDLRAVQASHTRPTLRLGGIGIAGALALIVATQDLKSALLLLMLTASLPVLFSGLLEDIGLHQSPRRRLLMATISSVLAIWLVDAHLPHIGISQLEAVFSIFVIAAGFTIFVTVGVAHAFNLIDGLNGLAGTTAVASCASFLIIAKLAGAPDIALVASALLAAMLGFLSVNYPFGRLFLGDAGAYLVGFLLGWIAVKLVHQTGTVAPWAMVLVLFWPIADTLMTIARRCAQRRKATHPDRMHFHHVVMRGVEIAILGRRDRRISNPLATAIMAPFVIMPPMTAILLWNRPTVTMLATLGFALLFVPTYLLLVVGLKSGRLRRRRRSPQFVPLASNAILNQNFER